MRIQRADLNQERQEIDITWSDGHTSRYPLRHLRAECPCANCRTEREQARTNPLRVLGQAPGPGADRLTGIEPVGRYGMRLLFYDWESTVIYTFEYLREICPCEECRARRTPDETPFVHGIYIPK